MKFDMMIFQDGTIAVNGVGIPYTIPIPDGEELDFANADVYKEQYGDDFPNAPMYTAITISCGGGAISPFASAE